MVNKETATLLSPKTAPHGSDDKSHPYFTQKVLLHSFHAQQVFRRGFDFCANAIYSLSVILRIVGDENQARYVEGLVDEQFNKLFEDIRNEIARLDKLAETNGIEFSSVDYSHPKEVEAKITSPRAIRYIGLIREYDTLVSKLDTLWLSGVIPDNECSRSIYEWKRRILRLAGYVRSTVGRAINAARNNGSIDDLDAALNIENKLAPSVTTYAPSPAVQGGGKDSAGLG